MFSTRKVGGIRFVKLGRWQFSLCKCRSARPIKGCERRVLRSVVRHGARVFVSA